MKKISILFIFSLILGLFVSEVSAAGPRLKQRPKHVVLVAFDGLSAVAIRNHPMPNFNRLMKEGASTLNNRSILPSSSAPNWASMFTGVGPELHGYTTWGSKTPEIPPFITNQYGRFPGLYGTRLYLRMGWHEVFSRFACHQSFRTCSTDKRSSQGSDTIRRQLSEREKADVLCCYI